MYKCDFFQHNYDIDTGLLIVMMLCWKPLLPNALVLLLHYKCTGFTVLARVFLATSLKANPGF